MSVSKKDLKEEVRQFIFQKDPQILEEFEIVLKPLGSDLSSDHIKNLVNAIYYVYLQEHFHSVTRLYILVRQFSKAFKEREQTKKLFDIWTGSLDKQNKVKIPVPTIEVIILRDLSTPGFRIGKKYNYGDNKVYNLGDLNLMLQSAKQQIIDIFFDIYLKHDVNVSFQMPAFKEGHEQMPVL